MYTYSVTFLQCFSFPCGRWLGRSIDDGSIERLLVAEIVPSTTDHAGNTMVLIRYSAKVGMCMFRIEYYGAFNQEWVGLISE